MENKSTKRQKTAKNMHKDSKKRAVVMTMKNRYCDSLFLQHHGIRIGISDLGQYSIKQKMNLNFYYSILKAKRETEK